MHPRLCLRHSNLECSSRAPCLPWGEVRTCISWLEVCMLPQQAGVDGKECGTRTLCNLKSANMLPCLMTAAVTDAWLPLLNICTTACYVLLEEKQLFKFAVQVVELRAAASGLACRWQVSKWLSSERCARRSASAAPLPLHSALSFCSRFKPKQLPLQRQPHWLPETRPWTLAPAAQQRTAARPCRVSQSGAARDDARPAAQCLEIPPAPQSMR